VRLQWHWDWRSVPRHRVCSGENEKRGKKQAVGSLPLEFEDGATVVDFRMLCGLGFRHDSPASTEVTL